MFGMGHDFFQLPFGQSPRHVLACDARERRKVGLTDPMINLDARAFFFTEVLGQFEQGAGEPRFDGREACGG